MIIDETNVPVASAGARFAFSVRPDDIFGGSVCIFDALTGVLVHVGGGIGRLLARPVTAICCSHSMLRVKHP